MSFDPVTRRLMITHIKSHSNYPATKEDLVKACNNLSDFTRDQKRWFEKTLPAKTYESAGAVIRALRL